MPPLLPQYAPDLTAADRRPIPNLVVEARKYSALAVDTLVELTKDNHADSTRYNAATALLDRGYGRPAQSLDLHLSADAITKRLSDMTDAELAARTATPMPGRMKDARHERHRTSRAVRFLTSGRADGTRQDDRHIILGYMPNGRETLISRH
jgi:hypothetical protein